MTAATPADWAAFLWLGLALSATGAIPVLLWVDADYLLIADWQALGDRLLVEIVRAKHTVRNAPREAALTAATLCTLLTAAPEANR